MGVGDGGPLMRDINIITVSKRRRVSHDKNPTVGLETAPMWSIPDPQASTGCHSRPHMQCWGSLLGAITWPGVKVIVIEGLAWEEGCHGRTFSEPLILFSFGGEILLPCHGHAN